MPRYGASPGWTSPVSTASVSVRTGSSSLKSVWTSRHSLPNTTLSAGCACHLERPSQEANSSKKRSRTARHKGGDVAVFASARKLATLVYRMLRYGQDCLDIGEQAYEAQFQHRRLASLAAAAQSLGYTLVQKEVANG